MLNFGEIASAVVTGKYEAIKTECKADRHFTKEQDEALHDIGIACLLAVIEVCSGNHAKAARLLREALVSLAARGLDPRGLPKARGLGQHGLG